MLHVLLEKIMQRHLIAFALAAALLAPVAYSDPAKGQGQGQGQGQGKGQGQHDNHGGASSGNPDNHGQVVSECNHRANGRKLKGQDRNDFVEWCTDSSERHGFEDRRWDGDRNCYQKADKKGLSGDKRKKFVRDCLDRQAYGGYDDNGKDKNKGKKDD
jgi:hypothetical protein